MAESAAADALMCRSCREPLTPVLDTYPLLLCCPGRHSVTLGDLLLDEATQPEGDRGTVLSLWRRRSGLLRKLAGRALKEDRPFAAANLKEMADRMDGWAAALDLLLQEKAASPTPRRAADRI